MRHTGWIWWHNEMTSNPMQRQGDMGFGVNQFGFRCTPIKGGRSGCMRVNICCLRVHIRCMRCTIVRLYTTGCTVVYNRLHGCIQPLHNFCCRCMVVCTVGEPVSRLHVAVEWLYGCTRG